MTDARAVLSVSEVTGAISAALEAALPQAVWVRGETSGVREGRGNLYFDLVETDAQGKTVAKLPVHVLRWQRGQFDRDLAEAGMTLESGVDVLVAGKVSFWAGGGQLRLEAVRIDPTYTLGMIARRRREVLERIAAEGLARRNAEQAVPLAPLRIGVVAAASSEAAADIHRQLAASGYAFTMVAADARVQGGQAPASVADALGELARIHAGASFDIVVVARGGGSEHDLSGFDDERVVRAIATAPFPVWTGIGHEQNRVAADEVAHAAWPTPTAAARGIVDRVTEADARVTAALRSLATAPQQRLDQAAQRLQQSTRALATAPRRRAREAAQRLDAGARALARAAAVALRRGDEAVTAASRRLGVESSASLARHRARVDAHARVLAGTAPRRAVERRARDVRHAADRLEGTARLRLAAARGAVDVADARLRAADPQRILERGFAHLRDQHGATIPRRRELPAGEPVTAQFADGEAVLHSPPAQGEAAGGGAAQHEAAPGEPSDGEAPDPTTARGAVGHAHTPEETREQR